MKTLLLARGVKAFCSVLLLLACASCALVLGVPMPDEVPIDASPFGSLVLSCDSISGTGIVAMAEGRVSLERGGETLLLDVEDGTRAGVSFTIGNGAIVDSGNGSGALLPAKVVAKVGFSKSVAVKAGDSPWVSIDEVNLGNGDASIGVGLAETIVANVACVLLGKHETQPTALCRAVSADRVQFTLRDGASVSMPGVLLGGVRGGGVVVMKSVRADRVEVAVPGGKRARWDVDGGIDLQCSSDTVLLGNEEFTAMRASDVRSSLTLEFKVTPAGEFSLSNPEESPARFAFGGCALSWREDNVAVSADGGRLELAKISLTKQAGARASWGLRGNLWLERSIGFVADAVTVRCGLASPAECKIELAMDPGEPPQGLVRLEAPIASQDAEILCESGSSRLRLAVGPIELPSMEVRIGVGARIQIGRDSALAVKRAELIVAGKHQLVVDCGRGASLAFREVWVIDSARPETRTFPTAAVAAENVRVTFYSRSAAAGEPREVHIASASLAAKLSGSLLVDELHCSGAAEARVMLEKVGSLGAFVSVAGIHLLAADGMKSVRVEDLQVSVPTGQLGVLLKDRAFGLRPRAIKFGDPGDLSPIKDAHNTGGSVALVGEPKINGLVGMSADVDVDIPFHYQNSHWKWIRKYWVPRDGRVWGGARLSSAFNGLKVLTGSSKTLETAELELNLGLVRCENLKLNVEGTGNFQKVVAVGVAVGGFLSNILGGVVPLSEESTTIKWRLEELVGSLGALRSFVPSRAQVLHQAGGAIVIALDGSLTLGQ